MSNFNHPGWGHNGFYYQNPNTAPIQNMYNNFNNVQNELPIQSNNSYSEQIRKEQIIQAHDNKIDITEKNEDKINIEKNDLPLATIYVRPQPYKGVSTGVDALKQGTAFAELYRSYKTNKGGIFR